MRALLLLSLLVLPGCQFHWVMVEYNIEQGPVPVRVPPIPQTRPGFSAEMDHGIYRGERF